MREEHEPSDHYTMAQFIQQEAKKVVQSLELMTTQKSAWLVWERFRGINETLESLRGELDGKQLLEVKDENLDGIIKDLERGCIEYDGEEPCGYFGYYIRDYANELIDACKRCMSEREQEIWEINV